MNDLLAAVRTLRGNSLRRLRHTVLGTRIVGRVLCLAPRVGGDTDIVALLADRVRQAGADAFETATLLAAVVHLLASLAGAGVAKPSVNVGARGADQGVRGGGVRGCGVVLSLAGYFGLGVGLECVLCGCGAGREGLGMELRIGVVADLGARGVTLGGEGLRRRYTVVELSSLVGDRFRVDRHVDVCCRGEGACV